MSDAPQHEQKDPTATAPKTAAKSTSKLPIIIVGVILLLIAGSAVKSAFTKSADEKLAENIIEKVSGDKVNVDAKDGSFSVTDKDTGETATVGANQKIPSDFPKDEVPYLNEKSVTLVISTSKEGKKNWSVSTTVKQSLEEAVAFFEGKIKEPDYTNVSSYGYNTSKTFTGKSAKYDVFVTVAKNDAEKDTTVTYVIAQN